MKFADGAVGPLVDRGPGDTQVLRQRGDIPTIRSDGLGLGDGSGFAHGAENKRTYTMDASTLIGSASKLAYMSTLAERIKAAREAAGIERPADLAHMIGIKPAAVYQWENGTTKSLKADTLARLSKVTGVSADWIRDGTGSMHGGGVREEPAPYLRSLAVWEDPADLPPEVYINLPRLDSRWSCGPGGPDPEAAEAHSLGQAFRADFVMRVGWKASTHFSFRAEGNSMEPTIQDGASVVVDTTETVVRSGKIYAIKIDGEPCLKRLFKVPGGLIRISSDNTSDPSYAAIDVPVEKIEIIGRVVWTASML